VGRVARSPGLRGGRSWASWWAGRGCGRGAKEGCSRGGTKEDSEERCGGSACLRGVSGARRKGLGLRAGAVMGVEKGGVGVRSVALGSWGQRHCG